MKMFFAAVKTYRTDQIVVLASGRSDNLQNMQRFQRHPYFMISSGYAFRNDEMLSFSVVCQGLGYTFWMYLQLWFSFIIKYPYFSSQCSCLIFREPTNMTVSMDLTFDSENSGYLGLKTYVGTEQFQWVISINYLKKYYISFVTSPITARIQIL